MSNAADWHKVQHGRSHWHGVCRYTRGHLKMQWQLQRPARSRELQRQKMIKWMPTSPVVELAAAQAECNDLDAISACRISACVVGGAIGREGSCSCSGAISGCISAISACILDYPCYHLSNKTPVFLWYIMRTRVRLRSLVVMGVTGQGPITFSCQFDSVCSF